MGKNTTELLVDDVRHLEIVDQRKDEQEATGSTLEAEETQKMINSYDVECQKEIKSLNQQIAFLKVLKKKILLNFFFFKNFFY